MWRSFGGFDGLKVKDTKIESNWSRVYAYLRQTARTMCGLTFDKLKWHERKQAVANVERGRVWFAGLARFAQAKEVPYDEDWQATAAWEGTLFPCPAPAFSPVGIPD
jgi:hypothetical protein